MVTKTMLRLLPVQILLSAIGAVNGIVSSFFASNYVGVEAMSAVGLYSPIGMLITSISTVLVSGSTILCGKYMGKNDQQEMRNVFALNLRLAFLISLAFILVYVPLGLFDLTGFMTKDETVRAYFNDYMLGQAIGVIPLMLGGSFSAFLSIENRGRRTTAASLIYIAVNILLNFLFVQILKMEAFGLALASSLGLWVFLGVQGQYFLTEGSHFKLFAVRPSWKEAGQIFKIGLPGAASNLYQSARGVIVNALLLAYVGIAGVSAFAAVNNLMGLAWAVPAGMLNVSRMLFSVSTGEADRQTLADVMRVMFRRFIPIVCGMVAVIILCAVPFTRIFYQDPAEPVYMMTVWGFRILPLCMPFSVVYMHFSCYGILFEKQLLVHATALLDGVVCVAGFTALLIPWVGMNSVYYANILNGVVVLAVLIGYAWYHDRHFPRNMEELMVIPTDFGVTPGERMDLTVRSMEDVVTIAERVQGFCLERGIGSRSAYLAGLFLEEMAGNVVDHGFTKDKKNHTVDVRVVHRDEDVILRIKDDCVPFDPGDRQKLVETEDVMKNIGIRMVYKMAESVQYQNILGMNVLTILIRDRKQGA